MTSSDYPRLRDRGTIGVASDGPADTIAHRISCEALPAGAPSVVDAIQAIPDEIDRLAVAAQKHIEPLGETDPVTRGLTIELVGVTHKHGWMLRAARSALRAPPYAGPSHRGDARPAPSSRPTSRTGPAKAVGVGRLPSLRNGRYWARTSDLRLVDTSGGVWQSPCKRPKTSKRSVGWGT